MPDPKASLTNIDLIIILKLFDLLMYALNTSQGEGWVSPDGPRPSSSGSNKEGSVPYLPSTNGR